MKNSVKDLLQQSFRQIIWEIMNRHTSSHPSGDIALIGSRRSGSTLLMKIIAQQKGLKSIDQPFSVFTATSPQMRELPWPSGGVFISPDAEEKEALKSYVVKMQRGEIHVREPWRFWRKDFDFMSNRLLLKTTDSHYISDILEDLGLKIILYFRHPIPQSISCMRNKWGHKLNFFAAHHHLRNFHLKADQNILLDETMKSDDIFSKYILSWCIENNPLFRLAQKEYPVIFYEDIVLSPDEKIKELASYCDVDFTDDMRRALNTASRSVKGLSDKSSISAIKEGNTQKLAAGWLKETDEDQINRAQHILSYFEDVPYDARSVFPIGSKSIDR